MAMSFLAATANLGCCGPQSTDRVPAADGWAAATDADGADLDHHTDYAAAFEDLYPLNPGHTLVVPTRHVTDLYDLDVTERSAVWALVDQVAQALREQCRPDRINVGVNLGDAAGQTIDHAHVHVVPRRRGDDSDPRGGVRWIIPDRAAYWS